jgi:hypothetical protein
MKIRSGDIVYNRLDNLVGKLVEGKENVPVVSLESDDTGGLYGH